MCTVTYIPQEEGFILSSNRDESPLRADNPLVQEEMGNTKIIFPRDTKGGSWLFASNKNQVVCVLNGAFHRHNHLPPYAKSRGLIAKSYFTYNSPRDFFESIDLKGIEPFTMIIIDGQLYEFRWDETIKHVNRMDSASAHIWSSSTLYSPEIQEKRSAWFRNYLSTVESPLYEDARYVHRNGTVGDPMQNYIMNRADIVKTISISHVIRNQKSISLNMENLESGNKQEESLVLERPILQA